MPKSSFLMAMLLAPILTSCGQAPEDEGRPTSLPDEHPQTQAVSTATDRLVFSTDAARKCSPADQSKLRAAWGVVRSTIADPRFVTCLKDSVLSGGFWDLSGNKLLGPTYAEYVNNRMREDVVTTMGCVASLGGAGCAADAHNGFEDLDCVPSQIDSGDMSQASVVDLASLLIHEIGHNKDYWHPSNAPDYSFAVTGTVQDCLKNININGVAKGIGKRRSTLDHETSLAPVGKEGGSAGGEVSCSRDSWAFGLGGRSNDGFTAISLSCRRIDGSAPVTTSSVGSTAGTAFTQNCLSSEVMVGLWGRAGEWIDAAGPICASVSTVQSGGTSGFFDPVHGGTGGGAWQRQCPPFMAVKAVRVRQGGAVDQIELTCQSIEPGFDFSMARSRLNRLGGTGGSAEMDSTCPGRSVMNVLYAHRNGSNPQIVRIGGECTQVSATCSNCSTLQYLFDFSEGSIAMPFWGGVSGGTQQNVVCPFPRLPVGVKASATSTVQAAKLLCADPSKWATNGSVSETEWVGGVAPSSTSSATCARGEFLVGWRAKFGAVVDSITPICRRFR